MTDVRELLARATDEIAGEVGEPPVGAIVAAGRRRARRRLAAVSAAGVTTAAVLVGALALPAPEQVRDPSGLPAPQGGPRGGDGGACAVPLDRDRLPGRAVRAGDSLPTNAAADLLRLHGWPRAVPYDVARWTLVTDGDTGALVAWAGDSPSRYLPMARRSGTWEIVGGPCTP